MSQMTALCKKLGVKADVKMSGEVPEGSNAWKVTLRFQRRRLTVPFYTRLSCGEPTAADVLACLVSDAAGGEQSFEDFCSGFGYDSDSSNAEATWKQCVKIAPKLQAFLGKHFETFQRARH